MERVETLTHVSDARDEVDTCGGAQREHESCARVLMRSRYLVESVSDGKNKRCPLANSTMHMDGVEWSVGRWTSMRGSSAGVGVA